MSRYIDADNLQRHGNRGGIVYWRDIEAQPTADVVEVVRCKDCKYWQDNNGGYPNQNCRWMKDETPDDDDYCSYGERADA